MNKTIDFNKLNEEFPHLKNAWDLLSRFITDQPKFRVKDILGHKQIEIKTVLELSVGLQTLIDLGYLNRRWGLLNADGTVYIDEYDEVADIPNKGNLHSLNLTTIYHRL